MGDGGIGVPVLGEGQEASPCSGPGLGGLMAQATLCSAVQDHSRCTQLESGELGLQ